MAGDTIIIGNWNDTTPSAPAGADNVKFQKDASSPPNISAHVPRADTAGTKYGTIIYDGSGNADRYLGADGNWHDIPAGLLPEGGTPGQILSISDASPSAPEWIDMPSGALPNGGTTGQVLEKVSDANGDVGWADQSGGAGGNGIITYTPPSLGDFSWINQGTATAVQAGKAILLTAPAGSGASCRLLKKSLSGNAIIETLFYHMAPNYGNACFGIALRESSTGKIVVARIVLDGWLRINAGKYNSPTSWSAEYGSSGWRVWCPNPLGLRWRIASGTRYAEISLDGENWLTYFSVSATDFCTPDEVGFFAEANNSEASCSMSLVSWKES